MEELTMTKFTAALLGLAVLSPLAVLADDRPLQVVGEMIEINAKPAAVWSIVKDFDGLQKWHPAIPSTPLVKGKNGQRGAVRALTIKDVPTFTEELVAYDDARMSLTYVIIESPLPLDKYQSSMTVYGNAAGGTTVSWVGTFTRKNPRDKVGDGESDADAVKLISGAYQAGLQNVKKMAEGK
jgi:mxaD protein